MRGQQMTIEDYFDQVALDELEEAELVRRMSQATGLTFTPARIQLEGEHTSYEAKKGKIVYDFGFEFYMGSTQKYIGVGVNAPRWGAGSPCDSIEEAIEKMLAYMERAKRCKE